MYMYACVYVCVNYIHMCASIQLSPLSAPFEAGGAGPRPARACKLPANKLVCLPAN